MFNYFILLLVKHFSSFLIADLAEKLFKHVEGIHEKFEVKLLFLNLVSRLIGVHEVTFYLFDKICFMAGMFLPRRKAQGVLFCYTV